MHSEYKIVEDLSESDSSSEDDCIVEDKNEYKKVEEDKEEKRDLVNSIEILKEVNDESGQED